MKLVVNILANELCSPKAITNFNRNFFFIYNIKIYKHEIQEKLNKKHIKIQGLNIHYKPNAYNEAAQYNYL